MTDARETILARLDRARPPAAAEPPPMSPPPAPRDPIAEIRDRLADAGGTLQLVHGADWARSVDWPVDPATSDHVYSSVAGVDSRGVGRSARSDRELDALSLCVLRADFAVVENGAAWHVPRTPRDRAAALLALHLVVVVDADELLPTLHEAYQRIDLESHGFGWFLCGPSKTADIEQALVLGAHGACSMRLVVVQA